jgi:hypothetical protein
VSRSLRHRPSACPRFIRTIPLVRSGHQPRTVGPHRAEPGPQKDPLEPQARSSPTDRIPFSTRARSLRQAFDHGLAVIALPPRSHDEQMKRWPESVFERLTPDHFDRVGLTPFHVAMWRRAISGGSNERRAKNACQVAGSFPALSHMTVYGLGFHCARGQCVHGSQRSMYLPCTILRLLRDDRDEPVIARAPVATAAIPHIQG